MTTRRDDLLDAAYAYVLEHGISTLSLRPLADAIGSSTGVLRFLFESKDGLITALLERAHRDEQALLDRLDPAAGLADTAAQLWLWLAVPRHRRTLVLWAECYSASLTHPNGSMAGYAARTVSAWLAALTWAQPAAARTTPQSAAQRTAVAALLRGCLLDLLATGDVTRTTRAIRDGLARIAG